MLLLSLSSLKVSIKKDALMLLIKQIKCIAKMSYSKCSLKILQKRILRTNFSTVTIQILTLCKDQIHLVCFISNCVIEQPVDAFQILMVVACWLLIFRKKILIVVAYFGIID